MKRYTSEEMYEYIQEHGYQKELVHCMFNNTIGFGFFSPDTRISPRGGKVFFEINMDGIAGEPINGILADEDGEPVPWKEGLKPAAIICVMSEGYLKNIKLFVAVADRQAEANSIAISDAMKFFIEYADIRSTVKLKAMIQQAKQIHIDWMKKHRARDVQKEFDSNEERAKEIYSQFVR